MQIIYTELKNTLEYICSINVFDTQMLMRVSYNSRSKKRLISLTSLDESILFLKPTYITEGSRVFPNVNAKLNGLSFYITLNPLSFSGENYKGWANQYQLCFVEYTPYTNLTTNRFYYDIFVSDNDTSVTPSFSDWVITEFEIVNQDIKYFGEKTNTVDTYDSYALYPLEQALVNSFHDVDMQQYAAFTSAVEQLIGAADWVLDPANNRIKYWEFDENTGYLYAPQHTPNQKYSNVSQACTAYSSYISSVGYYDVSVISYQYGENPTCTLTLRDTPTSSPRQSTYPIIRTVNIEAEKEEKYLPLPVVAQQVISNSTSTSIDEVLKMLSEDYINLVANSVLNADENKQFVKLYDAITQFESNKTLRS